MKALQEMKAPAPGDRIHRDAKGESQYLESMSGRIRTLEQLLSRAKVNLDVWAVDRFVVNQWEVGAKGPDNRLVVSPLFQVKAWLKSKTGWTPGEFRQKLLADMRAHAPRYKPPAKPIARPKNKNSARAKLLYEISVFDAHVGKLCWHQETGDDYDLKIAERVYLAAVEDLLARVENQPIERILFPIGNDFLHADNSAGTTTRGTPQDVDGRWQKAFLHARRMIVAAVDRMRQRAPVEILVVPGNHDLQRMFYLGDSIESWYRNDKAVSVDNAPNIRKYKLYGINLLGFTHGSEEKPAELPRLMADEQPDLWAKSRHREWHLGHRHIKRETQFLTTDTHGKTVVRILPSLSGTDAWHHSKGYKAPRGSEAYLWDFERGYAGHFYSGIQEG